MLGPIVVYCKEAEAFWSFWSADFLVELFLDYGVELLPARILRS